ncbi:hypothetical protein QTP88_029538 [Uroleucon formosanum]
MSNEFNEFLVTEKKPIFNSKIIEVEDNISKIINSENIIITISEDKIITHPAVREIVKDVDLNKIQFSDENRFYTLINEPYSIIFYCIGRVIRYALAIALASTDAPTVAQAFVECYVCTYGIPKSILTDCGTNFLSDVFKGMCKLLDIDKAQTTPWHPQANGFLERSYKTLKTYLGSFVDKNSNWDKLLCYATFCYNTTVHTSTNFTPYELVFVTKPNIPSAFNKNPEPQYNYDNYVFDLKRMMQEAHKIAKDNLIKKKETNKTYYDKTINSIDIHVGDKVLLKEQNKKKFTQSKLDKTI